MRVLAEVTRSNVIVMHENVCNRQSLRHPGQVMYMDFVRSMLNSPMVQIIDKLFDPFRSPIAARHSPKVELRLGSHIEAKQRGHSLQLAGGRRGPRWTVRQSHGPAEISLQYMSCH